MGKVVVVTSGKGGVGKTTSTAALGAALAMRNEKVVLQSNFMATTFRFVEQKSGAPADPNQPH